MTDPIVVTGAPGSGKTTLVAHLAKALELPVVLPDEGSAASQAVDAERYEKLGVMLAEPGASTTIVETCAYGAAWQGAAQTLIAVVDAVAGIGAAEADRAAIQQADLVVLTRGDLVDTTLVHDTAASMVSCKVIEVEHGRMAPEALPEARLRKIALPGWPLAETWDYSGAARLDAALAERLLKGRPKQITRIKGRTIAGETGLMLDLSGRARSVTPCGTPPETLLFAAGPPDCFHGPDMALHFAEIASAASASAGWFGFR